MPFTGSTFGLYTDTDLLEEFSGIIDVVHYTDLSDNPQDFTLYLGSLGSSRTLQASSNPGIDYITLTPTDITPEWEADTVYTLGVLIQPVSGNGLIYQCTTAGTSDSGEPTWPIIGLGSTVVDNSCVWTLYAAHHPITEVKLALSSIGLDSATGGAALSVAVTIDSLAVNAVPIYIRVENTVTTVSNNTDNEEIGIYINGVIELGAV